MRDGTPVQVMNPHKPERDDEKRRIEELGGVVLFIGAWRVNGNISVSRAIGEWKPCMLQYCWSNSININKYLDFLLYKQ